MYRAVRSFHKQVPFFEETRMRSKTALGLLVLVASLTVLGCTKPTPAPAAPAEVNLPGLDKPADSDFRISKEGAVYKVRWDNPCGRSWIGVGLIENGVFSVAWDFPHGGNLGVAVYKIEKGTKGPKLVG